MSRAKGNIAVADIAAKHNQIKTDEPSTLDILPWFLALAFGRAWLTLTYASPNVALPGLTPLHYTLFDLVYCARSVIVVITAHTVAPLCEKRWARGAALTCMLAASACCVCVMSMGFDSTADPHIIGVLTSVGAVLAGAGFALLLLLWSEVLSTLSMRRIVMQLAAAQILALIILFFCRGLDPLRMGIVIVALPFIAIHSINRAWHSAPATARPQRTDVRFAFPWKIVLLLGVYSFAYGIRQETLTASGNISTNIATVIVMAFLFVGARFFADKFSLSLLYRSPIPLMICGFLLIPAEGIVGPAASNFFVSTSYVLANTFFALLLYDIVKRMGIVVVALFGIKNAMQVFIIAGDALASALQASHLSSETQTIILSLAVVGSITVATFLLFSERELTTKWGVSLLDAGSLGEQSHREEVISTRCDEVSRASRLSPREDEVLRLLAKEMTAHEIACELGIAEGTAKAHVSHIYEKTGVSGRCDLDELLGVTALAAYGRN